MDVKRGRKSKLTPEVQERVVAEVLNGNTLKDSARLSRISQRSLFHWLNIGRQKNSPERFRDFYARVSEAQNASCDAGNGVFITRLKGRCVARRRYESSRSRGDIIKQILAQIEQFRIEGRIPIDILVESLSEAADFYQRELDEYTCSINSKARWFSKNRGLLNG